MRFSPKSVLLCSVLFSVGCATTPSWMVQSKSDASQQTEKAKLLQAAKEYERDGNTEMARQIYERIAAKDAKSAEPQSRVTRIVSQEKDQPERALTAKELLAEFEKSRKKQHAPQATQIAQAAAPEKVQPAEESPFKKVASTEALAQNESPAPKAAADSELPPWAAASVPKTAEVSPPAAPAVDAVPEKIAQDQTPKPESKSDLPVWSLDNPSEKSAEPAAEQLAEIRPTQDQPAESEPETKTAQSINDWWDNVFVAEANSDQEPQVDESDNPFAAPADSVEVAEAETEQTAEKSEVKEDFQTPVPIANIPEFRDAVGGWQRTSLARLCPELKPELDPLVRRLDGSNEDDRIAALIELADMGADAETAKLAIRALHDDENELVQIYAAAATRSIESDAWDSVKVLTRNLASEDSEVVHLAAYTLGKIGPEAMDAADALSDLRDAELNVTSLYAAEALTRITPHDGRSFDRFTKALESKDADLRWFAAVTLGNSTQLNQERAVIALAEALQDDHPNVRTAAALSLGGFGGGAQPVMEKLKHAAEFDTPEVREAARTALACLQ